MKGTNADRKITLATLTIRGLTLGETGVELQVIQVDDDAGDVLSPKVVSQSVNVC